MSESLKGNPQRQATASLRGYRYQILQTVHEWLDLKDGERLYLEGAEDYDRIVGSEAQATQIKHSDTDSTITLRTPSVVAALNSFWLLSTRNSHTTVRFNFLTTARIGTEAGAPFGVGRAGLRLWLEVAQDSAESSLAELTGFLTAEGKLSPELLGFLNTATPAEIHRQLLKPIAWRTAEPSLGDVEAGLLQRVRARCIEHHLPEAWAQKLRDRLETAAWVAATQQRSDDRVLTRQDLERHFLEVQTVALPVGAFPEFLANALSQALATLPAGTSVTPLSLAGSSSRLTSPPPAFGTHLMRATQQARVLEGLQRDHLIQLQGSSGTGKTIQAAAVAAGLRPAAIQWVNCRDIDSTQLRLVLNELSQRLNSGAPAAYIILDDLDVLDHAKLLEEFLPGMLYVVSQRAGGLLLTSNQRLPLSVLSKFGLTAECIVPMTSFEASEVVQLLGMAGLAAEANRATWASVIWAHTSGHPQLVMAHIAMLSRKGFPPPTAQDLTRVPEEVRDVRTAVRLLLGRDLPPAERELLYRLSVVSGSFRRERALALAEADPVIAQPGDVFDALVGPWIERISDSHYRLSPLLAQAGSEANGPDWLRRMNAAIAWAWLSFKEQTPSEIATILVNATLGEDFDAVLRLALGLFNTREELWPAIAEANPFFVRFYLGKSARFPGELVHGFYFRWLQIQLAAQNAPGALVDILERVDEEFRPDPRNPQRALFGYMLRLQALARASDALSPRPLVQLIRNLLENTDAVINHVRAVPSPMQEDLQRAIGTNQTAPMLGVYLVRRVTSLDALPEALAAIDELDPAVRKGGLALFRESPDMARQWADALWLSQEQASVPNWPGLAQGLRELYRHALTWEEPVLAQGVASVLVRVLEENLSDTQGALSLASEAQREGPGQYLLLDARAKVLFRSGENAHALALWKGILAIWPQDPTGNVVGFAVAARHAALAAIRLEDWLQGSELFERAAHPDLRAVDRYFACGLMADAAHAAWHAEHRPRAIDLAEQAVRALAEIPNSAADLRAFYLHKAIGHLMTWMVSSERPAGTLHESAAGSCSTLDPPKSVTDINPTPLPVTQVNLVEAAQIAGLSLDRFQSLIDTLRRTPYSMARNRLAHLLLEEEVRSGSGAQLVSSIREFLETRAAYERRKASGAALWEPDPPDGGGALVDLSRTDPDFWMLYFALALLSFADRQHEMSPRLRDWVTEAQITGAPQAVSAGLEALRQLEQQSARGVLGTMRDATRSWSLRLGAIAVLLGRPAIDPLFVLHAHSSAMPLADFALAGLLEGPVCRAVARAWRTACAFPMALRKPAETVGGLLQVCDEPGDSWRKVGRLFLAATPATEADVPSEITELAGRLARS